MLNIWKYVFCLPKQLLKNMFPKVSVDYPRIIFYHSSLGSICDKSHPNPNIQSTVTPHRTHQSHKILKATQDTIPNQPTSNKNTQDTMQSRRSNANRPPIEVVVVHRLHVSSPTCTSPTTNAMNPKRTPRNVVDICGRKNTDESNLNKSPKHHREQRWASGVSCSPRTKREQKRSHKNKFSKLDLEEDFRWENGSSQHSRRSTRSGGRVSTIATDKNNSRWDNRSNHDSKTMETIMTADDQQHGTLNLSCSSFEGAAAAVDVPVLPQRTQSIDEFEEFERVLMENAFWWAAS